MHLCSVCGVDIEERTASPDTGYGSESYAPAQEEYRGEIYYFCGTDHKEAFQADPERYADGEKESETDE